ncbi:transaldolase [Streptomyces abyssalis]|uniref:Transaldolase n=1 Tax=Streptomyces abyssalis TaxID=933944 RepID=A0A1E7JU12_9ACTN|nr:transaldolase [Streptomyces abyssalis]OEU88958.1 transaldolase [Streptomyces abyssalis]OEU93447.1 transaldolase [Streptomyces abyssalis]OEV31724.1 transaldolase [Streptomyces nanshensis]
MTDTLERLADEGVAPWLDDLSRERLAGGWLSRLVSQQGVVGITSNPTIFDRAIGSGPHYDAQIADLARRGVGVAEAARLMTAYDVRWACDILRGVHETSGGVDGRVSIEVDPRLAHDTGATLAEARGLWWLVDRPNLFVKIPATREGLGAISAALAEGISVNVTLIFSLDRYDQVIGAFLDGMEEAHTAGRDLSSIASVASFFVSRVDTETDNRLDKLGSSQAQALRGRAALANARLAYEHFERARAGDRWQALEAAGMRPQRPLWASTGVKDPSFDDTRYVAGLVAPDVVNTMPEATLRAVEDHGEITGDTVHSTYAESQQILDDLDVAGVSYHDVVTTLEDEGVRKFADSWSDLFRTLEKELRAAGTHGPSG